MTTNSGKAEERRFFGSPALREPITADMADVVAAERSSLLRPATAAPAGPAPLTFTPSNFKPKGFS